jgi:hypothetical protein
VPYVEGNFDVPKRIYPPSLRHQPRGLFLLEKPMNEVEKSELTPNGIDAVWGAKAIGEEVNLTEREARYRLERGDLPGVKVGRTWTSTRRKLRAVFYGE